MTHVLDADAVCSDCRWRFAHAPSCPRKNEPWPTVYIAEPNPHIDLIGPRGRFRKLESIERDVVDAALKHHDGNRSATARALGIGRSTLWRKMVAYGLS